MSDECSVCCEPYTKRLRRRVACNFCDAVCCSACLQKYLLGTQSDAQCMGCRHALDGEYLAQHLPRAWLLGPYKAHRERVLLEREMALLPASQNMLAVYRDANEMAERAAEMEAERRRLVAVANDMAGTIADLRHRVGFMRRSNYTQRLDNQGQAATPASERRQFTRACPVDTCRGFLSTAWRCGTCEVWVCKDCGEPKEGQRDPEHVCDPNIAASHAVLQRETKPCPQCAAMIFKVDGCDQARGFGTGVIDGCGRGVFGIVGDQPTFLSLQMWCTQCHVAFSWRTGQVVTTGVIHNPHYYEWVRRTRGEVPRQPGDVPCGGAPSPYELTAALRRYRNECSVDEERRLREQHRYVRHLQTLDLPRLRAEAQRGADPEMRNADLRLRYLLNQVDGQEWQVQLQKREKRRERAAAELQVHDMFAAAAADIFTALVAEAVEVGPRQALDQLSQLQSFANESLAAMASRFNMRVKRLRGS